MKILFLEVADSVNVCKNHKCFGLLLKFMNQCCCKESGWGRKHETMKKQKYKDKDKDRDKTKTRTSTHALMQWSKSEAGSDVEIGYREFKHWLTSSR